VLQNNPPCQDVELNFAVRNKENRTNNHPRRMP
jgi:hypothetical protein